MPRSRSREVYSEATTRRQVPALFKEIDRAYGWPRGARNADIGGGSWDDATKWLAKKGVENIVYDPGNRSDDENLDALSRIVGGQCDTATVANVLNVIPEAGSRSDIIELAAVSLKEGGIAFFSVHEGHGDMQIDETRDGYQNNARLAEYVPEVERWFEDVRVVGRRIEARRPVAAKARAAKREYGL